MRIFKILTFLFLSRNLWCDHSLDSSRRDESNECHTIGFNWEMRKKLRKMLCSLALDCSLVSIQCISLNSLLIQVSHIYRSLHIQSTLDISKSWGLFFTGSNYPKCKFICTSGNLNLYKILQRQIMVGESNQDVLLVQFRRIRDIRVWDIEIRLYYHGVSAI